MNPLIKWSGGKKDELVHILQYIPKEYNIYLESFIGACLVARLGHWVSKTHVYKEMKQNLPNELVEIIGFYLEKNAKII